MRWPRADYALSNLKPQNRGLADAAFDFLMKQPPWNGVA
jgi:hypothetical protein